MKLRLNAPGRGKVGKNNPILYVTDRKCAVVNEFIRLHGDTLRLLVKFFVSLLYLSHSFGTFTHKQYRQSEHRNTQYIFTCYNDIDGF